MRLFNSFQIVAIFIAWPFFISWLSAASFAGAQAAFYSSCVVYVVSCGAMIGSVYHSLEGW